MAICRFLDKPEGCFPVKYKLQMDLRQALSLKLVSQMHFEKDLAV
jgi:hypothetical protein